MWGTVFQSNACKIIAILFIFVQCIPERKMETLPYYNTADFTPIWINDKDSVEALVQHTINHFSFQDQHGNVITRKHVEGKLHIANFFFTTCTSVCPRMTEQLRYVQNKYHEDSTVVLLSFSVTPWLDNADKLAHYAERNEINSRQWHLLTGDKANIYTLARKSYFAEETLGFQKDSSDFLHTEHVLLIDQHERIRGIYNGTLPLETERLMADIEVLKNEIE